MNTAQTLMQMQQLKLTGMYHAYKSQLDLSRNHQMDGHELLEHLIQSELTHRGNEKTAMLLRTAKLRLSAAMMQVECNPARNLTKQQLALMAEGNYIKQGQNILITGATGCGKSFIACALGHQACLQGHKTTYLNMNRLIEKITLAKLDGSYLKMLNQMEKQQLVILDDFGLHPTSQDVRLTLLQLLEDRYEKRSVIITSQLPVSKWYEHINDPTLADAIMDRLSANSIRIELKGKSRRTKN